MVLARDKKLQETATPSLRKWKIGMALLRACEPTLCSDTAGGAIVTHVAIIRIATAANPIVPAWFHEAEIDVAATTSIAALKRNNDEDYVHAMLQDSFASEL